MSFLISFCEIKKIILSDIILFIYNKMEMRL